MTNPFEDDAGRAHRALEAARNPFRPGMGRVPPDFGGREGPLRRAKVVVDQLAHGHAPEFVLYRGVRGVGKTALLAYVREQARRRGIHTLHVEADREDERLDATLRTLLRGLTDLLAEADEQALRRLATVAVGRHGPRLRSDAGPSATLESLVDDIARLAEAGGVPVLLTVDEVHEGGDRLLKPLLRAAHRVAQDGQPLGVLLSGLPTAAESLFDEGQTYTERLARVDLGLLQRDGTAEAIRRPFLRDAALEVDDLVVDAVHDGSGGYPWFVQLWGESLWDLATDPQRLELPVAREAGERVHLRIEDFYLSRWRRVPSGRAAQLVLALADAGGEAAMGDLLEGLGIAHQAASPARRALSTSGCAGPPVGAGWRSACRGSPSGCSAPARSCRERRDRAADVPCPRRAQPAARRRRSSIWRRMRSSACSGVGAVPPRWWGSHHSSPGSGCCGYSACACASRRVIRSISSRVASTGSSEAGTNGSP